MRERHTEFKTSFILALDVIMIIAAMLALVSLIINMMVVDLSAGARKVLAILDWSIVAIFVAESFIRWGFERFSLAYLKRNWPNFALVFLFLVILFAFLGYTLGSYRLGWLPLLVNLSFARAYLVIVRLYVVGNPLSRAINVRRRAAKASLAPAQIVPLSFLFVILTGTCFLLLPEAVVSSGGIEFIDALFTATSATCVTGLIVVDTGSFFSRFGQIVILFLIQIGGLGLMTVTTFFSLLLGRSMSVRESILIGDALSFKALARISYLVVSILALTFIFEAMGALFLCIAWWDAKASAAFEWGSVPYYSIFHSISAFCNAGFSLFRNNFEDFKGNFILNITVTSLIIFGGLGFIAIMNVLRSVVFRRERLSLHTKLVLTVTVILIVCGSFLILVIEWNNGLIALSLPTKLMAAYFQSVTPRTAGFNTINMGNLTSACHLLMIILMFIGASPGGTGGGVKTSTFGVFLGSILSMLKGRKTVEMFKRNVPENIVHNALLLITMTLMILSVFAFILLLTQEHEPIHIFFELFSAFGTVGLSAGITPHLTILGKFIIIITMFIGRVGPLTLALAISQRRESVAYKYPDEDVMIG